jgi:hypothetical protein
MSRREAHTYVRQCDRCGETKSSGFGDTHAFDGWSLISAQAGHPTSILRVGDGYNFDACDTCTASFLAWVDRQEIGPAP